MGFLPWWGRSEGRPGDGGGEPKWKLFALTGGDRRGDGSDAPSDERDDVSEEMESPLLWACAVLPGNVFRLVMFRGFEAYRPSMEAMAVMDMEEGTLCPVRSE